MHVHVHGLLARMVNAMGSRPLCRLEAWGRDSMVSEHQGGNNGPLWAMKDAVTEGRITFYVQPNSSNQEI